MMKQLKPFIVACAIWCFSQTAFARDSGVYLGAGLANGNMESCMSSSSNCTYYTYKSDDSTHLRIVGGYDFNKYVGVEGGWSNLGRYDVPDSVGYTVGKVKATAITMAVRGGYKFNFGLSVFAKLGLASVKAEYTPIWSVWPFTLAGVNNSQRSSGILFGTGIQYDLNDFVGFRLSRDMVTFKDDILKGATLSMNLLAIFKL